MSDGPTLTELVAAEELDADLAGLLWLLADHGVPLVVAATDRHAAERLRGAVARAVRASQPALDALPGGVVIGDSLEDVLRRMGDAGSAQSGPSDDARDLGVVVVVRDGRPAAVHYMRPVERDAAGHLQRRPPAVLSAWNAGAGRLDHFYWAVTDELATRAGMTRHAFEDEHERRAGQLLSGQPGSGVVGSGAWH
jgi:hypothetical protein